MEENALEVASLAGHILLENGAEIARVEETMTRIASHYGVKSENFYVLSNGIFTTGENGYAKVEFIPFKGAQLERVVEVNQISRDIAADKYTLAQAGEKLEQVRRSRPKPKIEQIIGSAIGSAGFCIIFGGSLADSAVSFVVGALLWTFVVLVSIPHLSKIIGNIAGGLLATLLCMTLHGLGLGDNLGNMIVGSLIPLIPGVPFTNGIRDIAEEDYIAGATRLMDATMVFFCIAAGAVIALMGGYLTGTVEQIRGAVSDPLTANMVIQGVAALLGTMGFAVLFGVPRKEYFHSGIVATAGWISYLALIRYTAFGTMTSILSATVIVMILARMFAIRFKKPQTVYLITGIFPMIPGGGIFWTAFFLMSRQFDNALHSGLLAIGTVAAIVLGIVLISPLSRKLPKKKKRRQASA